MMRRAWRHVFSPSVSRTFPPATLRAITDAIEQGEQRHGGQVMFAVEADLPLAALWQGVTPRQAGERAFAHLRTWDTANNNGVLIYLLLADHAIEIVADRGLRPHVPDERWQAICVHLGDGLRGSEPEVALRAAIAEVSGLLAAHFPPSSAGDDDALPNVPQILG